MKRVGLFFGGMSNEAEVSIVSARNIEANIDRSKYELVPVFWDKQGIFHLVPSVTKHGNGRELSPTDFLKHFDVAFPITHGKYGEDGVLQAILEAQHVPYCGCRVLSSALCMDKAVFRSILTANDIPQAKYVAIDFHGLSESEITEAKAQALKLRLPWFVKPANSGSSVGITKIKNPKELESAIADARKHDDKVLIEEGFTDHQEIELSVLGNAELVISPPGQLKPSQEFYTYDDKYVLDKTEFTVPAVIDDRTAKEAQVLAEKVYRLCDCKGFARIDMFIQDGKVYMNEINTLPGFTDISMYPRLMKECGISYPELLSKIIELAY
jgi:D-alanine-D-alanine ligase